MLLGGNLSSGNTDKIQDQAIQAGIPKKTALAHSDKCCSGSIAIKMPIDPLTRNPMAQPMAVYPSMLLNQQMNSCPPPTPADFAKFPKVAVPSSVRTQAILDSQCLSSDRFARYERYRVPVPCLPLPASANMAGKSQPTSIQCNIYPNT